MMWRPCPDPECGLEAEVVDAWIWNSADGGVWRFLSTECVQLHRFYGVTG